MLEIFLCIVIIEEPLLTIEIFKYETSEDVGCEKQSAQKLHFGQYD